MSDLASGHSALEWLYGARVQRVDGPQRGWIVLTLFMPGSKPILLLSFGSGPRGVGSLPERPKGEAASGFVQRLRGELEGARLLSASWLHADEHLAATSPAHALTLIFRRGEHEVQVVVDFDARSPNLLLLRNDLTIAAAAEERARRERFESRESRYHPRAGRGVAPPHTPDELHAHGIAIVGTSARQLDDALRKQVQARVRASLARAERKVEAIRGDLTRAALSPLLRREAQLLLCHLDSIPRGTSQVRLLDESVNPPEWLEIALQPDKEVRTLVQLRFDRARKLERGVSIGEARLVDAEAHAAGLRTLLDRLQTEAPESLLDAARSCGVVVQGAPAAKKRQPPPQRTPYRTFLGSGGARILVGKGAADNDTLTLKVARPHDHWLHLRGGAGSHVVVPIERKAQIAQELLLDAAHLAAHFSSQRGEPVLEISHTERRFVRKSKGSAPGSVQLERERVLVLRVQRDRLARLLGQEQP